MQKCYSSKKNTIIRRFCLITSILLSIFLMGLGVSTWFLEPKPMPDVVAIRWILFALGSLILFYGFLLELQFSREYEICEQGILIRYITGRTRVYPWASINQICLCTIHVSGTGATWDEVIWCTAGKIKKGPPHPSRRWNDTEYGLRYFSSVLTMEYSPERLAEFEKYAPCHIEDYRSMRYI